MGETQKFHRNFSYSKFNFFNLMKYFINTLTEKSPKLSRHIINLKFAMQLTKYKTHHYVYKNELLVERIFLLY